MTNDTVRFNFNGKKYKMTMQDKQAIKTADHGVEYRPVVKFNIKINGLVLNDIMVNLNDRSNMDYPLLIGKNILHHGKFLIDPQMESIDWDTLQSEFNDIQVNETLIDSSNSFTRDLYNILEQYCPSPSRLARYNPQSLSEDLHARLGDVFMSSLHPDTYELHISDTFHLSIPGNFDATSLRGLLTVIREVA